MKNVPRETFTNQTGFILACVGSAVSIGNIWLFPVRLSRFGGATFLIPYLICMIFVASTGVIGEIAFGRLVRGGPVTAFSRATKQRFNNPRLGRVLGIIPNVTSLFLACGYFVVLSWSIRYFFSTVTGDIFINEDIADFTAFFNSSTLKIEYVWIFLSILIVMFILFFGVREGIERINRIFVPIFYIIFLFLAIYVASFPKASFGYAYLFRIDFEQLKDPLIWIYALGQSFFSLAVTGAGLIVYGSFLKRTVSIPKCTFIIAFLDLFASLLAALIIIPAMAISGQQLNEGGAGLLFIYIPYIFRLIPGGRFILSLFFLAVFLVGVTTLINLVEVPIIGITTYLKYSREFTVWAICSVILVISLIIRNFVLDWINFSTIFLVPVSAALSAIMFYWVVKQKTCLQTINHASKIKFTKINYLVSKYVYVFVDFLIVIFGFLYNSIG